MVDKVLVVDDEKEIRDMLSDFLTKEGYEVIQASNGEEALELAEIEKPQVILLDIGMPGLGGILTCQKLKSQESTCTIPVIAVSALEVSSKEAIEAGADEFVPKPINLAQLSSRVKSILRVPEPS